ncbi:MULTISPECIES: DUF4099 domain-containing protein [Hymenobacter]|uniref:DUF4099 domain-containing protein n=1 Tax=Hymenobacter TaxID=89966 RepID=UPI0010584C69|nr:MULTISPECIES: DUF4099 domain-containing protein [Hymenobacter]QIL78235.1 DUF3945 domain-containing protein [Hymenobacter sp. HDW8]
MTEQAEPTSGAGEQPNPQAVGPAAVPKKPAVLNVEETRDEFIKNAQPVAAALRQRGKEAEATQLEQAAHVIALAVGAPRQATPGDALKGESVSQVLQNIWDVIDKDPALQKLPQAQNLRKAGLALDGAGLLNITIRDGVIVSFVSNFADNFSQAQKAVGKPGERPQVNLVRPSLTAAVGAQQPAPAQIPAPTAKPAAGEQPAAAPALAPAAAAKPTSLLAPEVLQKAKALYQENQLGMAPIRAGFTREDLPLPLLEKMGVKVAELEQSGQLQKLLSGQKTDLLSSFSLRNAHGEEIPFAAKLVLRRDAAGAPSLQFDLPKQQLVIPEQILGKEITPAMKEQLTTHGVVPLSEGFRDGKGQTFAAYVAIDQEMNRVVAVRREGIAVPKELLGVPLSPQQNQQLLGGYPTKVTGMTNQKSQLFDATVVLDPVKRTLRFRDVQPHVAQQLTEKDEAVAPRPKMRR